MEKQGTEVAKFETGLARPPDRVIAEAKIAVNVFKSVIEQKPRKVIINKEQYLEYEDWQTLGEFYRCSAITKDAMPVEIDGVKGAKAHADLVDIDTGLIIGGAEAYCLRDEENWGGKPWFQLASMAQTRAGAKAFRNRLAWVAVMAGYRPTPAEEMAGAEPDRSQHWCKEHDCAFFMKGKMKSYAHPIGDTGEWCHEHKEVIEGKAEEVKEPSPEAAGQATEAAKAETKPTRRDPATIKNLGELYTACKEDFGLKTRQEVWSELNVNSQTEIADPVDAYRKIAQIRG